MRVDVVENKNFIIATAIAIFVLIVAIIVGATGPDNYVRSITYAYDCPNNRHTWGPDCGGKRMSLNGTWYEINFQSTDLNDFWVLLVAPYLQKQVEEDTIHFFQARVNLYAQSDKDPNIWLNITGNNRHEERINCRKDGLKCDKFALVLERFIRHRTYKLQVQFPDQQMSWIGDVEFELLQGNIAYSKFEYGFRIAYGVLNIIFVVAFFMYYKSTGSTFVNWTYEQRAIIMFAIVLVSYNNPIFGIKYAASGWFFPFVNSLAEITFLCVASLFRILLATKIRNEENNYEFGLKEIPKVIVVAIMGIIGLILFAWTSIRDETDPVYGYKVTAIRVLFFLVIFVWTAIAIWTIIIIIYTFKLVMAKRHLQRRYLFFAVPTVLCLISILVTIFTGSFGVLGRNSTQLIYFLTMENVYVLFLLWGYSPIVDSFRESNALTTEGTPLVF